MSSRKLKIFISAYACEPNLGSEIGVGWHWALEMSKYFDLWVLTRKSNQKTIETWLLENPCFQNINFIYYDLPYYLRFWKKGLRGVHIYYYIWQRLTNNIVKQTMKKNDIKIYHLLTYGNAIWPVSKYGQKKFFIWGPISVGDTIPKEYSNHYNFKSKFIEELRRLSVKLLSYNKGYKKRCSDANLILCKTENTYQFIPDYCKPKSKIFTDVAVDILNTSDFKSIRKDDNSTVRYLAVGRLDAWRGFDLIIEAFVKAYELNAKIRLEILGEGNDYSRLKELIVKNKMEHVISLSGQVSIHEYYQKMADCDVVVNPCLKEGAVTTAFDSMSFGKPLICIKTGGYTRYFNDDYAVLVSMTNRLNTISKLTEGVLLLTNKKERIKKGNKAKKMCVDFVWQKKGKQIQEVITKAYYAR